MNKQYVKNPYFKSGTSYPEQFLYFTFSEIFCNVENRSKTSSGLEYDIMIGDINLYIEYSGWYWHEGKEERDQKKRDYCFQKNINFIEISDVQNAEDIEKTNYDMHTTYKIQTAGKNIYEVNKLLVRIVNDIINDYNIEINICEEYIDESNNYISKKISIDFNTIIVKAINFGYQYKCRIVRDDNNRIIDRVPMECGATNFIINKNINEEDMQLKLDLFNTCKQSTVSFDDYEILNKMMMNGSSLSDIGLAEKNEMSDLKANDWKLRLNIEKLEGRRDSLYESIEKLINQKNDMEIEVIAVQQSNELRVAELRRISEKLDELMVLNRLKVDRLEHLQKELDTKLIQTKNDLENAGKIYDCAPLKRVDVTKNELNKKEDSNETTGCEVEETSVIKVDEPIKNKRGRKTGTKILKVEPEPKKETVVSKKEFNRICERALRSRW